MVVRRLAHLSLPRRGEPLSASAIVPCFCGGTHWLLRARLPPLPVLLRPALFAFLRVCGTSSAVSAAAAAMLLSPRLGTVSAENSRASMRDRPDPSASICARAHRGITRANRPNLGPDAGTPVRKVRFVRSRHDRDKSNSSRDACPPCQFTFSAVFFFFIVFCAFDFFLWTRPVPSGQDCQMQ